MGEHRKGAGLEGQGDGRQRSQALFFYVGRATFRQPAVEGILYRRGHALPDQDGGDVGSPRPTPAGLLFELLCRYRQPELGQPGDEQFVSVVPGHLQPHQLVLERARRRVRGSTRACAWCRGAGRRSRCPPPARYPLRPPFCGRQRRRPDGRGRSARRRSGWPWRPGRRALQGYRSRRKRSSGCAGRSQRPTVVCPVRIGPNRVASRREGRGAWENGC